MIKEQIKSHPVHDVKVTTQGFVLGLKTRINNGYIMCRIKGEYLLIHRLVLETYVGPCPPGHIGAHIDGDKLNNRLENLKWATPEENVYHRLLHTRDQRPDDLDVIKMRHLYKIGAPVKKIAERFKISTDKARLICQYKALKHVPY